MPQNPESEGSPRLMTVTEIAVKHDVSRQTIHTYRRTGVFPPPVEGEGSTRLRFREDEVAAFFKANPKQPRKKRHFPPRQQGDTVTTATPRDRLMETLKSPGLVGLDAEDATHLVDAYRAAVLREAAEVVYGMDTTPNNVEAAAALRRMADEPEPSDG